MANLVMTASPRKFPGITRREAIIVRIGRERGKEWTKLNHGDVYKRIAKYL